ncbi:hypothetical protein BJX62DRAFT_244121 [Aspergillus germanicus]
MALYIFILLFVLNLNLPTLALAAAAAAQCPPRYVFDENIPLHTASCSAIALCVNDDGSMYLPTDDNIDAPCVSMLIALRCPEVVVVLPDADGEDGPDDEGGVVERKCEYSVLRWDEKGLASQVCCGSFDVVFKEPEEEYGDEEEFDGGEYDDSEEEEEEEEGGEDFEDEDENDQGEFDEEDLEEDEVAQEHDGVEYDEEDTAGGDYEEGDYDEEGDNEQEEDDEAAEHEDL